MAARPQTFFILGSLIGAFREHDTHARALLCTFGAGGSAAVRATYNEQTPPTDGMSFSKRRKGLKKPQGVMRAYRHLLATEKRGKPFRHFYLRVLGKQLCGGLIKKHTIGDLVISSAQIWRASFSCEMEMKTWHVLECLILLICFNSRSLHKH